MHSPTQPWYSLVFFRPPLPPTDPNDLHIAVLKVENPLKFLEAGTDVLSNNFQRFYAQFMSMPRFASLAIMGYTPVPLHTEDLVSQKALREIVERASPETLKEFMLTM
jgi:hypothetical protein